MALGFCLLSASHPQLQGAAVGSISRSPSSSSSSSSSSAAAAVVAGDSWSRWNREAAVLLPVMKCQRVSGDSNVLHNCSPAVGGTRSTPSPSRLTPANESNSRSKAKSELKSSSKSMALGENTFRLLPQEKLGVCGVLEQFPDLRHSKLHRLHLEHPEAPADVDTHGHMIHLLTSAKCPQHPSPQQQQQQQQQQQEQDSHHPHIIDYLTSAPNPQNLRSQQQQQHHHIIHSLTPAPNPQNLSIQEQFLHHLQQQQEEEEEEDKQNQQQQQHSQYQQVTHPLTPAPNPQNPSPQQHDRQRKQPHYENIVDPLTPSPNPESSKQQQQQPHHQQQQSHVIEPLTPAPYPENPTPPQNHHHHPQQEQQESEQERQESHDLGSGGGRSWKALWKQMARRVCDGLEGMIIRRENPPSHADPQHQSLLTDRSYFSPVDGESGLRTELEVVGELPAALNGAYIRTGPNPQMTPSGGYSFFDGDGMLHCVRIKDGAATYSGRFVRTSRFLQERAAGQPLFIKPFGELHGLCGLARMALLGLRTAVGLVDLSGGWGAANTGLMFFHDRLLAMSEDDLPYVVHVREDGDLETLQQRYDCDGELRGAMTSHPKVDARTGEMFCISSSFGSAPYLKYFVVSPEGVKGPDVAIRIPRPMIAHDFAVTANFAVLPDLHLVVSMPNMLRGGSAIAFDASKTPRLGVLPRYATSDRDIQWFDIPDCFCFHYWTAWEERDGAEIVLTGSLLVPADKFFSSRRPELRYELTEIRLDRSTGIASRRPLAPRLNLESGQINQSFYGRKCRFVYLAIMEPLPTWVKVTGIAKIDLSKAVQPSDVSDFNADRESELPTDSPPATTSHESFSSSSSSSSSGSGGGSGDCEAVVVGMRDFRDENYLGSEPFFVPRTSDPGADEDDGYVLTYVHDCSSGFSQLLVMDAKSPTLETVAAIKLPVRVPYGLHGIFVTEDQLSKQFQ